MILHNLKRDWVLAMYESIDHLRASSKNIPVPADAELVDALHAYVGRVGMMVGQKRFAKNLTPAEMAVINMLTIGISYLGACATSLPGSPGWEAVQALDE